MPQRSLLIEAFIAKAIRKQNMEDGVASDEIQDDYLEGLSTCSALSLEFLQPYLNDGSMTFLCYNSNIPWQHFEEHIDEISDEDWENLATNSGIPKEFFKRNLYSFRTTEIVNSISSYAFSDEFLAAIADEAEMPPSPSEILEEDEIPPNLEGARYPEIVGELLERDWSRSSHSLEEIRTQLDMLHGELNADENSKRYNILRGMAKNPNLTPEFVKECQEKSYNEFVRKVFELNNYLPWSFFEENLEFVQTNCMMTFLANKPQISWDFLLQHPELIFTVGDEPVPQFRAPNANETAFSPVSVKEFLNVVRLPRRCSHLFGLGDLLRNKTITETFVEKYLPDILRLNYLHIVARNSGLPLAFFERNVDLFVEYDAIGDLCTNESLPILFFERHPEVITLRGLLNNKFTYQFDIESGKGEEETIYNAQVSLVNQGSPNNLPNLMLGVMREQHGKMVNRAYHR